jgi:sugar lactone lactonase YvrE
LRPNWLLFDASGRMLVSDTHHHRILRVGQSGQSTVVAGNGIAGFSGDGGSALYAQFNEPLGMVLDAGGNLLVADSINNRVRRIREGF